eukprot:4623834-Amphidinium_carterae.2
MAGARVGDTAPDIEEPMVAIDFFDDAYYCWHARALLLKLNDEGRWVVLTPTLDVEAVQLSTHRVIPLAKGAPYPERVADDLFTFDHLTEEQLVVARQDARSLGAVLGVTTAAPAAGDALWYYSDTAEEEFGTEVGPELLRNPASCVMRESTGIVHGPSGWTTMQRVLARDVDEWRSEKHSGPGRDPRVLPLNKDQNDVRFASLREALSEQVAWTSPPSDWPFRGPSALMELLRLSPDHPVAHKHRDLVGILLHMVCWDQLNVCQLASGEMVARLILQVHQAVERNPKNPDFKGTEIMVASDLFASKAFFVGDFAKFVAEEQKSRAFTMKQHRLYHEEVDKEKGAASSRDGAAGGGGGKGKPKAKPLADKPGGGGK